MTLRTTLNTSEFKHKLMFQKCLFFNFYLYLVWIFVIGIILVQKIYTVPEMGGFLLITNLMQLPLVSFFLFNPYLMSMPVEIILNAFLWMFAIVENVYGYLELKHASAVASSIYYAHYKEKHHHHGIDQRK